MNGFSPSINARYVRLYPTSYVSYAMMHMELYTPDTNLSNTFLGINAGNFTSTIVGANTSIGRDALTSLISGAYNTALGTSALRTNSTAHSNTAI